MNILIAYASAHGSTAEVAAFIGRVLDIYDINITVAHADEVKDVSEYDIFMLGSPIHSSMWLPSLSQFMFRFEQALQEKPVYLWINCLIVLEEGGRDTVLNRYLWDEALNRLSIDKGDIGVFGGKLDWDNVNGDERWLLSANYEGRQLPGHLHGDYRDWEEIASWVHHLVQTQIHITGFNPTDIEKLMVKDETITEEEVDNLQWPDNPNEAGKI